ncbi:enhancer of filamentation 1 isoform X2 [Ambystoma mexicanum]|uniref:enhancer of filamentation 1 isoform X2 n=1 Tax=Ambystoma mexicanum TaxID=8296 RepID=UPI0037E7F0B8
MMKYKNLMARALYDNVPESAEELAFRKGDILTVIEQNTEGLEGWWLCSLHGRQGIAPGNRLKLLIGPVDMSPSHNMSNTSAAAQVFHQQQVYQVPNSLPSYLDGVYQVPLAHQNNGIYQVPRGLAVQGQDVLQGPAAVPGSALATDGPPMKGKVVTPMRVGQGYAYDFPSKHPADTYDIPPARPLRVYDMPPVKGSRYSSPVGESRAQGVYDIPPSQGVYDIPPSQGVYDIPPSQGLYDIPPLQGIYASPPPAFREDLTMKEKAYDFLPSMKQKIDCVNDVSPSPGKCFGMEQSRRDSFETQVPVDWASRKQLFEQDHSPQKDVYDIPRGLQLHGHPGGTSERLTPEREDGVYDVPQQVLQGRAGIQDVTDGMNRLSFSSTGSSRSNMSTSSTTSKESSLSASLSPDKMLLLDPDTAIVRLYGLQQAVEASIAKLIAFVNSEWRSYMYMEKHVNEIHAALDKVEQSLTDYIHFAKGATVNACSLSEPSLHNKMRRELQRLEDSHQILTQTGHELSGCSWSLNVLVASNTHKKSDNLDRSVMVARTVPDDAKQLTTTISANSELLFKRTPESLGLKNSLENSPGRVDYIYNSPQTQLIHTDSPQNQLRPLNKYPHSNGNGSSEKSWMDDYDYVHLQGKEDFERQQRELLEKENLVKQSKALLEQHQVSQIQQLEKEIIAPVEQDISKWESPELLHPGNSSSLASQDKQLLLFYSNQCETHFICLLNAIDAFFNCVRTSQPPRIFVAHSKFVILSAHKLVFIGDTLSRQVVTQDIRNRVMNSSNQLCELLKTIVAATKMAALHYPSTVALQEMVDRVTELSNHAQLFKLSLVQMASL